MTGLNTCLNCGKTWKSQHTCRAPQARFRAKLLRPIVCDFHGRIAAGREFEVENVWEDSVSLHIKPVGESGMRQSCRVPLDSVTLTRLN